MRRESQGARGVLERLLPGRAEAFMLETIPLHEGQDAFEIESEDGRIVLRGASSVAQASALNWYLKHVCHAHVSWCGNQLQLTDPLPEVHGKCRIVSPYRYRYYFNYCTFSYSMPWWAWPRWEREIDWMALHGINLPLALTGQEAVWQNVYRKMGLTDEEILAFIAGPAYLAWGWMGNLDGWGGPSPQHWIDGQCALQKQILARERELGMTPVLPAFTGHVPAALVRHFPEARIRRLANWAENFPGTYILDPTDPLFVKIGTYFLEEQTRLYGTDHHYSCDTFNENCPPSSDPDYLGSMGATLYRSMATADPKAVWVMQAWMFFFNPENPDFWQEPQMRALLRSVDDAQLLVLDLNSDHHPMWTKTRAYYGKPWIWNVLQNFGGNRILTGDLETIATEPPRVLRDPDGGQLVGMGMTPEGIEQNPVVFDLAADMMWRTEPVALEDWLPDYILRRYARRLPAAEEAFRILRQTVYAHQPGQAPASALTLPPSLKALRLPAYDTTELARAWDLLASCAGAAGHVDPYRYDLVDVARQVLSNLSDTLQAEIVAAYEARDAIRVAETAVRFKDLILDMDALLATRPEFLLGKWIADARAWGSTDAEKALLEWNARNQLTLWGNRESMLRDYARKEWSGLLRGFYLPRWEAFFENLQDHMARTTPYDNDAFQQQLRTWEEQWTHKTEVYPNTAQGDAVEQARRLLDKYRPAGLQPAGGLSHLPA